MTIRRHPLLSTGNDAAINRVLGKMRSDLCVIQSKPSGFDAGGAPLSGPYTNVAAVGCRIDPSGRVAVERIFGQRLGPETDYVAHFPRETMIQSDDRVVANGATLAVVSSDAIKSFGNELLVALKAST